MGDTEVAKIVDKLQKIRALKRAREAVRQLERELYGAVSKPAAAVEVPRFLNPLHSSRIL
jgi:cob(I)alamin adenosyltransferase